MFGEIFQRESSLQEHFEVFRLLRVPTIATDEVEQTTELSCNARSAVRCSFCQQLPKSAKLRRILLLGTSTTAIQMPDVEIQNLILNETFESRDAIDIIDGVGEKIPSQISCTKTELCNVQHSNLGEQHRLRKLQVKVDDICERMGKAGSQTYQNWDIVKHGLIFVGKPARICQRSHQPDQTMKRRANVWIPRRRVAPGLDSEIPIVSPAKIPKKNSFIVRTREMRNFFALIEEDPVIHDFLLMDSCMKMSDKYILAMVFAYFKRAGYNLREYNRLNFFVALYLANDMEEDEEELKYEVFPWVLGYGWRQRYPAFLRKRDKLWRKMGFRAVVSRRCCEEIMMIEPEHEIWQRDRPEHHAGAIRTYAKDPEDDGYPKGPEASPRICKLCEKEDQYDSASPASTSWYVSSDEDVDSGCENDQTPSPHETSFDMQGWYLFYGMFVTGLTILGLQERVQGPPRRRKLHGPRQPEMHSEQFPAYETANVSLGLKHTLQKDTDIWPLPEE